MEMIRLGRSGLSVSRICLGTMTFGAQADAAASNKIMDIAAERGVNFIDTANAYPLPPSPETLGSSEAIVGAWLKGKRERFILATKGNNVIGRGPNESGNSRTHLMRALDDSLRRLQTDYVDIYYLHHPDPQTPLDEAIETLDDMRTAGKIRYAAVSNMPAWQLSYWTCWSAEHNRARFACVQPRYNMLYRAIESELVPAAGLHATSPSLSTIHLPPACSPASTSPARSLPKGASAFRGLPGNVTARVTIKMKCCSSCKSLVMTSRVAGKPSRTLRCGGRSINRVSRAQSSAKANPSKSQIHSVWST